MSGQGVTGDQAPSTLFATAGDAADKAAQASAATYGKPEPHRPARLRTVHPLVVVVVRQRDRTILLPLAERG